MNVLRLTLLVLLVADVIAVCALAEDAPTAPQQIPAERRPYDVRLFVVFDSKTFDPPTSQLILREVDQAAQRCVGGLWALRLTEATWLNPVTARGLQRLDRDFVISQDLRARARVPGGAAGQGLVTDEAEKEGTGKPEAHPTVAEPPMPMDVYFVAAIEALPVGTRVSVRSWQPELRSQTEITSVDVVDRREIPIAILRICRDLMRPIGIVEQVEFKSVRIRLRAGELNPTDPSFGQLSKGDILLPLLAFRDKNKAIERLQSIPWTYVSVDEIDGSIITGTVQSGLRVALGGKKRNQIDTLVVALRPQHSLSRLELLTQTKPMIPLIAHRIEVRSDPVLPRASDEHPEVDPNSTLLNELLTDRRGMTRIPVESDRRLVWLFAYSGQNLLARVPFFPGIAAEVRLEVPDDSTRLASEADLQMLQGELIDAVALRNTAFATIRAAAKKEDWVTVNQKLTFLKQHQDASKFLERLVAIRVAGTTAAKARKDKAGEVRINRMCDDAVTLIKAHLGEEKVEILSDEMKALQNAEAKTE